MSLLLSLFKIFLIKQSYNFFTDENGLYIESVFSSVSFSSFFFIYAANINLVLCFAFGSILIRLNKEEYITRIIDGIYTKTKISKLTNEIVPTDPHTLALKIADNFSWKIIPTGNHALNLLGLSEQVPTTYEYLSTGPYRIYEYKR